MRARYRWSAVAAAETLGRAQEMLRREINPSVYPSAEYRAKLAAKHHFLSSVLKGERIFLIGDQRELARLAKK